MNSCARNASIAPSEPITDAPLYYRVRLATSYVLENRVSGDVIGYFSLAHDRISLTDFPSNSAYNRFRKQFFAQGKMFKSYPALKICRLATDSRYRGEGVGTMLVNMIIASYKKESKAGCRFITVDAYAGALDFYFKQGFAPLSKDDEGSDTRLLYFDLESFSAGCSTPHDCRRRSAIAVLRQGGEFSGGIERYRR